MPRQDLVDIVNKNKSKYIDLSLKAITRNDLHNIISLLLDFETIDLSRNMLNALPPSFDKLSKLKKVILSENYFKTFPEELLKLQNLEYIDLGGNFINKLPRNINKLCKLKFFYLKGNPLKNIPEELFSLTNLEILGLVNTRIYYIPEQIYRLKKLEKLWIGKNRIKTLPNGLINLKNLKYITLDENPLPIPEKILKSCKNAHTLFNAYKNYINDKLDKQYEVKIIILGESGAGKTSLLNRIIYDKFYDDEEKTENINIEDWIIQLNDKMIKINIWDFGGQDILYSLHKFFITSNSLFIIVWDARNENQSKKIEFWLNSIKMQTLNPKIILVMNKMDEHISNINKNRLKNICSDITFYNISCKYNWNIDKIKEEIRKTIKNNENYIYSYDKNLLNLKKELKFIKNKYIDKVTFKKLVTKYNIKYNYNYVINIFNDIGVILNFSSNFRLSNYIFLDKSWFIKQIYNIINYVSKNKQNGCFNFEDIEKLYNDEISYNLIKFFIDALLGFEIIFEKNNKFYFPQMLNFIERDLNDISANLIKFSVVNKHINQYLFYKLLIKYNKSNQLIKFWKNVIIVNDNKVILEFNEEQELIIYIENNEAENVNTYIQLVLLDLKEIIGYNIDLNI